MNPPRALLRICLLLLLPLVITLRPGCAADATALLQSLCGPLAPAGFCVQLGCGDGALTVELAAGERLAVHALEADALKVASARERLEARKLYGQAVVEQWTAAFLPFADNLINVLLVENPGAIPESEMMRVLAPRGALWVKRDGGWQSTRKPWPDALDEWTHWRHAADGNMVSRDTEVTTPTGVRWIAGPAQDPGGRKWYYDHVLLSAAGRNFYVYEDAIVARDSFNGRLLWTHAAKACTFKETGSHGALKPAVRVSKVRPVAAGDRLYAAMDGQIVSLDAATGETAQTISAVDTPRELAVTDDLLLVSDRNSLRAFESGGQPRWQWPGTARRFVAGDGKVFCVSSNEVVCLALTNGKELWRQQHARAADASTCSYGSGVLALECSAWQDDGRGSGLLVFAGETGRVLWAKDYTPGMTHWKESRAFFADGLLWVQAQTSVRPTTMEFLGLDPRTGAKRRAVGTRGMHCAAPVATERYLIAPEMEFTDLKTGRQTRGRMTRGSCRLPYTPANGLLYTFPLQCECFPMLRGYMALAQTPAARNTGAPRLQRGPAFEQPAAGVTAEAGQPDEWPTYRHDRYRSGSTSSSVFDGDLKTLWTAQVATPASGLIAADWNDNPFVRGVITAPVCASETLLLAVPDRHRVVALDAATGASRWHFTAGGRVDTPPTIAGDRCVFGAHDGYVYCVGLADGQLVWRFRVAPWEARIAIHGQLESPWPVAGSVLVDDGVAYFAAGRHPASDGGLRVCALRVRDGKLLWEKNITDIGVRRWYGGTLPGGKQKVGLDFEPVDLMARDGNCVAMSRWRFDPKSGIVDLGLSSTNYLAQSRVEAPRGLWNYGVRQTKLVLDKPPAVFDATQFARGTTNDVAMLLAGPTLVVADNKGALKIGDRLLQLGDAPVRDGIISAGGRLYAATRSGKLYCIGKP